MMTINLREGTATDKDGKLMYWNGTEYQEEPISKEQEFRWIIDWYENQKQVIGRRYEKLFDNAVTAKKVIEVNSWYETEQQKLHDKYINALLSVK